jgi:hypothetical protein
VKTRAGYPTSTLGFAILLVLTATTLACQAPPPAPAESAAIPRRSRECTPATSAEPASVDAGDSPLSGALARFAAALPPDGPPAFTDWTAGDTAALVGREIPDYTLFQRTAGRPSFGGGVLRFVGSCGLEAAEWNGLDGWRTSWPGQKDLVVFAYDWLGRQYAFDARRSDGDEPLVTMLDPADGAILESRFTFRALLESLAGPLGESLLSKKLFAEWRAAGGATPGPRQCVGFKHPLTLGGKPTVDNLEMGDMEVYLWTQWQIHQQLARTGTRRKP